MAEQYLTAYAGDPSGDPIGGATLPGRHWHELESAFRAWGLDALADLWSRPLPGGGDDPWPFASYADPAHVDRIDAELSAFDPDRVHDDPDILPDEDDAEEVHWLLSEKFPEWVAAARGAGLGLHLVRAGAK